MASEKNYPLFIDLTCNRLIRILAIDHIPSELICLMMPSINMTSKKAIFIESIVYRRISRENEKGRLFGSLFSPMRSAILCTFRFSSLRRHVSILVIALNLPNRP